MKKAIALIAAFVMAFCAVQLSAVAKTVQEPAEVVSVSVEKVTAAAGSDVNVAVFVSGSYSANILHLFLDFDPATLQLNSSLVPGAVWNEIENNGGMALAETPSAGRLGFIALLPEGSFSSTGTVFTVSFHVSSEAAAGSVLPIMLTVTQFSYDGIDGTSIPVAHSAVIGSVTVPIPEPVVFSIGSVEAEPGEIVELPVTLQGDYSANVIHLFVNYDPSILTLEDAPVAGSLWTAIQNKDGTIVTNTETPGQVGFIALLPSDTLTEEGTLFTLRFRISANAEPGSATSVMLDVVQFSMDDMLGNSNAIEYESVNGTVTVSPIDQPLLGDIDNNGEVNMADVTLLSMYLNGENPQISEQGMINANANGDASVDIRDITAIYSIISNS